MSCRHEASVLTDFGAFLNYDVSTDKVLGIYLLSEIGTGRLMKNANATRSEKWN